MCKFAPFDQKDFSVAFLPHLIISPTPSPTQHQPHGKYLSLVMVITATWLLVRSWFHSPLVGSLARVTVGPRQRTLASLH